VRGNGVAFPATPECPPAARTTLQTVSEDYTPLQVADLHSRGEIELIDVRQTHEHEAGRISGSRLIELGSLPQEAHTIDGSRPVVFYCRSGGRSAMAADAFVQAGFDAHNMTGGMLEWDAAGLPIEPDGGHVAES
jgi:rhodanese-related sulfurtransferase